MNEVSYRIIPLVVGEKKKNYRASKFETVIWLIEQSSGLQAGDTAELAVLLTCEYAGCFGGGNVAASF